MKKIMLVNAIEPEESRIAILEDKVLEELYIERFSREQIAGNIYKGRVVNIESSIEAAFVDIGLTKNGFLHASDVKYPQSDGDQSGNDDSTVKTKEIKPRIKSLLKPHQEIFVQITKEGIGDKGPSLTTYVSLPGRFLVLMPDVNRIGISRKIIDETERKRLKEIIEELNPPPNLGFIVRTAGVNQTKRELSRDINYLQRLWKVIESKGHKADSPSVIYQESDLVIRTIRDIFSSDIDEITIDSETVYKKIRYFLRLIMPSCVKKLRLYKNPEPLFHKYNIENEIEKIHNKEVRLPRGGSIVIEQTEALVAIDVNSGKYREESDPEKTAFKTNIKAAKEIARQIRLRDIGGVVIIDFIDLKIESNMRAVEKVIEEASKRDRARTKMLKMSKFGIIQMTRQRIKPSLKDVIYENCEHCKGTGVTKTLESNCLDLMRQIKSASNNPLVNKIEVIANDEVAENLLNLKKKQLAKLEENFSNCIIIKGRIGYKIGEVTINHFDSSGNRITIK
ncbi:MAG: ribonuclease E/G [Candidatus Scalinduaceae bacterium]